MIALVTASAASAGDYNLQFNYANLQVRVVAVEFLKATIARDEKSIAALITGNSVFVTYDRDGNRQQSPITDESARDFVGKCLISEIDVQNAKDVLVTGSCIKGLKTQYMRIEVVDGVIQSVEPFSPPMVSIMQPPRDD